MLILLLPAKFCSVCRNRSKIAKQKLTILPSAGFLPNRLLNAFRVFAFLAQKTSLTNFFGRKHRLRLTRVLTHLLACHLQSYYISRKVKQQFVYRNNKFKIRILTKLSWFKKQAFWKQTIQDAYFAFLYCLN